MLIVVRKRLQQVGIKQRQRFTKLDDQQLLKEVQVVKDKFPNSGVEVMFEDKFCSNFNVADSIFLL